MMVQLTATLITRNEERNLPRALASLAGLADEILVVDSGSTDDTCAVARRFGARVLTRSWTDYSDQKNFAAAQAAHDWIFSLDADEELSPPLQESLRQWKQVQTTAVAYAMRRRARYLGAWIHHSGWYPDPKLRLYRRDRARFVGVLHESLRAEGPVGQLEGDLYHHTFNALSEHTSRINRYTTIAAEQLFAAGRRRWLLPLLLAPPWVFLRTYFFQQGFRDGYRGWLIAQMAAYAAFLKRLKLGVLVHGGTLEAESRDTKR